ncbi:MAG: thioredoxin-dependent thiol peroxidase [Rickettsiales bacterium]|nr:thioredoxin-dependent thiol peroxidase [Rickettsiales bacterium]OUV81851.1 MAG: thioredoxin-dependent thiol peroxidase [Rickettsiales bacterium TMED131]|tara:strand:+ start:1478 stop:1939 length:462 start_codon:yes stop_codon:yes gene_type:complete
MSINVNKKAPNFILSNQNSETVELKNLKTNLILFFYPKDNTPGCTKEAIGFSEYKNKFNALNYHIYGISKDSVKKHQGFISKQNLSVDLLSDESKNTCEEYGVWVEKSMYGRKYFGIERTTFLINKKQIITKVWNKVKVAGHVEEVLAYIENS